MGVPLAMEHDVGIEFLDGGKGLGLTGSFGARAWDTRSWTMTGRLDEPVADADFAPDGSLVGLLRSQGKGCELALEKWGSRSLLVAARERVTRNLTPEEWAHYIGDEPYRKLNARLE
ncbi:hypothetical protein MUP29_06970 [bacterium]|nr:hypothetical protein [bacterium]